MVKAPSLRRRSAIPDTAARIAPNPISRYCFGHRSDRVTQRYNQFAYRSYRENDLFITNYRFDTAATQ
jgi:hypothetical protein